MVYTREGPATLPTSPCPYSLDVLDVQFSEISLSSPKASACKTSISLGVSFSIG
jgi:hypothetical protein